MSKQPTINQTQLPSMVVLAPMAKWCQGPRAFSRSAEKLDQSSRTIPDESFTIKDLFDRHQKGAPLPLGIERPISYGDDPTHNDLDLSKIRNMDLATVEDLKHRVSATLSALKEQHTALLAVNDDKTTITAQNEPKIAP